MNAVIKPPLAADRAQLPAVYEHAKTALAECSRIDECEQWKDKALALASYARQANDTALLEYASRIKNRAVRRLGELSKALEKAPGVGGHNRQALPDEGKSVTKAETLSAAGISTSAANRAELVAEIPAERFDQLVDGPAPPTVSTLAKIGAEHKRTTEGKTAPLTEDDLDARRALGQITTFASFCRLHDPRDLAARIPLDRIQTARAAVATLDAWLDRFVTNLRS